MFSATAIRFAPAWGWRISKLNRRGAEAQRKMSTIGQWNEKWTEVKPLGGGGQGDTLLVRSNSDESKQAVLKLLKPHKAQDPKARRRMYQEVANLKILRNAGGNVPEVLDGNTESFEKLDLPMYFVMEFVAGNTLANIIMQDGPYSVDASIGIALELCSTLRIAAKEGIVHRDIKPENIIVRSTTPSNVVMVDFGLSFNEDIDQTNTSVDEGLDNKFISLPERRGPGENKRDPRSDITDLCAILFYCLTGCAPRNLRDSQGRPPHRRPNYELTSRVKNPTQLARLNSLLDRGLSNELDARFQTVEDLVFRLNEVSNPDTELPAEDLEAVVARESSALRKNDRKIQLTEFFQNTSPLGQSLQLCMNTIGQTLAKHRTFNAFLAGTYDRANHKIADGDCFATWLIRITVRDHPLSFDIVYTIVAHGTECEVGREVFQNLPSGERPSTGGRQVVLRYQGDVEPDKAVIVADVRAAVTRTISAISEKVRNGY
jgi:serine/threonine protein kinase